MKRYIILTASLVALSAMAQSPIDNVLHTIAENNPSIKATQQEVTAAQTELSAGNSLENPTVEFEYLWADENHIPGGVKYSFGITQGFDFPTQYVQRRKLINAQNALGCSQISDARRNILLEARNLCIKIVYLNKQIKSVEERVSMAKKVEELYKVSLKTGEANRLEYNKAVLSHLSLSSELKMLYSERDAARNMLTALNGGVELSNDLAAFNAYPEMAMPQSLDAAIDEWKEKNTATRLLRDQQLVAESFSSVAKEGWIPGFEVGYRQAYELGDMFYGLSVGISLPLFKTSNEVKSAKARALSAAFQVEDNTYRIMAEATQLYNETVVLGEALKEYDAFDFSDNRKMLFTALTSGQISLLEYMSDIATLNEAEEGRLLIEYQYYTSLSNLSSNNL